MGLTSNHYSIIYLICLLPLLAHAYVVQSYPIAVLRYGKNLLKLNIFISVIHLIQTLPLPTQQQRHCYRPMTFVVFLLPANIRGVYHYDMRSRPHALRPASTSVHANTNIAYLGSPGFSFDELCLSGHDFSVFEHLADAESYFSTGIFRPISQATPAVAHLQSRNQVVVDIFNTSPRLAAIDAASSSPPPPTRARQTVPETPSTDTTSPVADRAPITRHDRVSLTLRPEYIRRLEELRETATLEPTLEPSVTSDTTAESPVVAQRSSAYSTSRDSERQDEFAEAYSPTAEFNRLYTDTEYPNTPFVDIHYTQSPASRTSSSLFTSPTFLSFCTCSTGTPPCLAHVLLLANPLDPTANVSTIRQNRRLVRIAASDSSEAQRRRTPDDARRSEGSPRGGQPPSPDSRRDQRR